MVLADPQIPIDVKPISTMEWVAGALRHFAERLHPSTLRVLTPQELATEDLREAEVQLLIAEKEQERLACTVDMLRTRIQRLRGGLNV